MNQEASEEEGFGTAHPSQTDCYGGQATKHSLVLFEMTLLMFLLSFVTFLAPTLLVYRFAVQNSAQSVNQTVNKSSDRALRG